jgi:hypothetical protein
MEKPRVTTAVLSDCKLAMLQYISTRREGFLRLLRLTSASYLTGQQFSSLLQARRSQRKKLFPTLKIALSWGARPASVEALTRNKATTP